MAVESGGSWYLDFSCMNRAANLKFGFWDCGARGISRVKKKTFSQNLEFSTTLSSYLCISSVHTFHSATKLFWLLHPSWGLQLQRLCIQRPLIFLAQQSLLCNFTVEVAQRTHVQISKRQNAKYATSLVWAWYCIRTLFIFARAASNHPQRSVFVRILLDNGHTDG